MSTEEYVDPRDADEEASIAPTTGRKRRLDEVEESEDQEEVEPAATRQRSDACTAQISTEEYDDF